MLLQENLGTNKVKLTALIATYNRGHLLVRTLPSLFAQDISPEDYEVVVVVDGSTDGTASLLGHFRPRCALRVAEQPNLGQPLAYNTGLKMARGEIVLLLDDDIICEPNLIREHLLAHASATLPTVVCGPLLVAPETPAGIVADWLQEIVDEYLVAHPEPTLRRWPEDIKLDANSSVPRSLLMACGGFDPRFARARSDAELGLRLSKKGVRLLYWPAARGQQIFVKSAQTLVQNDASESGKSEVLLCRIHPSTRPYSFLGRLNNGPSWKRFLRRSVVRSPFSLQPLLRFSFWVAEHFRFLQPIRRTGIRLLKFRHWAALARSAVKETGSWSAFHREFGLRVPVLMYHHVGPSRPGTFPELTVSPERFERQIRWLAKHGYVGICARDWLDWCVAGKALPERPVVLTFDDAYFDLAEYALPVLRRFDFGATVFVVTTQVGGSNIWDQKDGSEPHGLMTVGQIRYWSEHGIEFGAHSRTHPDLRTLSPSALEHEIKESRAELSGVLGQPVRSFAYPFGCYDETVCQCVSRYFEIAFTIREGRNDLSTDPVRLRRTMVQSNDSLLDLALRVRLGWDPIEHTRCRIRQFLRFLRRLWR